MSSSCLPCHPTWRRELLRPSASVALHRHSNALVDILPPEADSTISVMSQTERPDVTYQVRRSTCRGRVAAEARLLHTQPPPGCSGNCAAAWLSSSQHA